MNNDKIEATKNCQTRNDYCKQRCIGCKTKCNYKVRDLERKNKFFTNEQISDELKIHNHAKHKKIDGKNRTVFQAIEELKNHYKSHHSSYF